MAGGYSGVDNNSNTAGRKFLNKMNVEKQNRHIPGTKEYNSSKSYFEISAYDLDLLIKENLANGVMVSSDKMELDLNKEVGYWKSIDGLKCEKTSRITLHLSKTGYHAVPARMK